jgi:hypothetical protein
MVFGIIFGISGICHGVFEVLQGNKPTGGIFISAIGEAQRMWPHGNEYALSLIPNFLVAGIAAIIVGSALVVWSITGVQKAKGPIVFLILFMALLLTGGGVAQIIFFPFLWLVSTRINGSLSGWGRVLSKTAQRTLGRLWGIALVLGAVILSGILQIAITGYIPLINDPETVLSIMLFALCAVMIVLPLTAISGFARDLELSKDTLPA